MACKPWSSTAATSHPLFYSAAETHPPTLLCPPGLGNKSPTSRNCAYPWGLVVTQIKDSRSTQRYLRISKPRVDALGPPRDPSAAWRSEVTFYRLRSSPT